MFTDKKGKISYLGLTELIHFSTALILFFVFSYSFGVPVGLLAFLGAFLVDCDHMFDYLFYVSRTKEPISLKRFLKADYFDETGKIFIPLHSWELAISLVGLYFVFSSSIFLVLGMSLITHLIVDQFTNRVNFLAYFLVWRAVNRFDVRVVCGKHT